MMPNSSPASRARTSVSRTRARSAEAIALSRSSPALAAEPPRLLNEGLFESPAVEQAGEEIVVDQVLQAAFEFLPFGDLTFQRRRVIAQVLVQASILAGDAGLNPEHRRHLLVRGAEFRRAEFVAQPEPPVDAARRRDRDAEQREDRRLIVGKPERLGPSVRVRSPFGFAIGDHDAGACTAHQAVTDRYSRVIVKPAA